MELDNVVYFSDKTFENLIFLPVTVNGIEVTAMFDTGAGMSFVTQSIADKFAEAKTNSSVNAGNNQGAVNAYNTFCADRIRVGDAILTEQTTGILPDEALNFGEDSFHNTFPASMLLGWDIISRFCWEFDMSRRRVRVYPGGTMPKARSLSWDAFPMIDIECGGAIYQVGFDSGHTESILDETWMARLHNHQKLNTVVYGVGSASKEEVSVIDEFSFVIDKTEIALSNIEIVQHQVYGAAGKICGLLGADILPGTKWIIDYQSRYFSINIHCL